MIEFGKNDTTNEYGPFLLKTEEIGDNCVKFIVVLSHQGIKETHDITENAAINKLLEKCSPLYPNNDEIYEISFDNYILHQTRNESFCSWDNYEIREGKHFIEFTRSRLLDIVPQLIEYQLVNDIFSPNKPKHYGIYCLNHIIDIISCFEPKIKKLNNFGGTP